MGEPLIGTASTVRRWLLVEQPGAWGPAALADSAFPTGLAAPLLASAKGAGVRVLVVRAPTRSAPPGRRCALVGSGPGRPWQRWAVVDDPAELLALDLDALFSAGGEGFGSVSAEPSLLVCTHGRHDPCCADLGRPLVRSMTAAGTTGLWESSHVGGDRFAGNLVCLPHGLYYGRVAPEDGATLADLYAAGRIDLAHYRGRSCWDLVTQAAEVLVRVERGLDRIDDVVPGRRRALGGGVHEVDLSLEGSSGVTARVQVSLDVSPRALSCGDEPSRPHRYELVALG